MGQGGEGRDWEDALEGEGMRRKMEGEGRRGMGRENSSYSGRISSRYRADKLNCIGILISGHLASTPPAKFSSKTELVYSSRDVNFSD